MFGGNLVPCEMLFSVEAVIRGHRILGRMWLMRSCHIEENLPIGKIDLL